MHMCTRSIAVWTASAILALLAVNVAASDVIHMNLRDLVGRADRILRGTVIESTEGTITAGGGDLPVVTYKIRVNQSLKGGDGSGEVIEVRLLGTMKQPDSGPYRRAAVLKDLPRFSVGNNYLFVLTRPSAIGLSTTVGLGQGLFTLGGRPGQETAVNGANNLGLFAGLPGAPQSSGPVPYSTLVQQINNLLAR